MRVEFEFTVDDVVDLNQRAMRRSKAVRSVRSRSIWTPTLISGPIVVITWILSSGSVPKGAATWGVVLGLGLICSVTAYFFGRWFYDWTVARRIRRIVLEQVAKADSMRCEIELRPSDLWIRQDGTQVTHSWKDMEEVVDTDGGIELRFRNGLVVARNQAFSSAEQRAEFLTSAKGMLS